MSQAGWRGWRVGLTTLFCLAFVVFGLLHTVSSTVLDAEWYQEVLDENDTYTRVYNQVLVDPEFKPILTDLTASLPIDRSIISSNLRLVIPPQTLRTTIQRAARSSSPTTSRPTVTISISSFSSAASATTCTCSSRTLPPTSSRT